MSLLDDFLSLTRDQRNAFIAAFLGWTLDAFDFFVLVFVVKDIAKEFHAPREDVALAITLTLAMRPVGALLFGAMADRYGRRIPLMIDIVLFSALELMSGFATSITMLLVLRSLFGVAMGGEWGLGTALAMETAPPRLRGLLSGILQEGYVVGYLLAAIVYRVVFPMWGWRALFFVGALPALLSVFIRSSVKESPVFEQTRGRVREPMSPAAAWSAIRKHGGLFLYLVVLMTAFNFMSHGTQDMYPTFLQVQRGFGPERVSNIVIIYNLGALAGGIFFGTVSQKLGRRRAIITAALLALPVIQLWAFSTDWVLLALGGFLMQFMVQGAWGVVPVHLSELSPNETRGTFPGFAYQLGNLFASLNAKMQTRIAEAHHHDYATIQAIVIFVGLCCVAGITALGPESKGAAFTGPADGDVDPSPEPAASSNLPDRGSLAWRSRLMKVAKTNGL